MMPTFTHTEPVNPPGEPPLTREQAWQGLVMKAEDATRFVPGMSSCVVVERFDGGLLREATYRGNTIRERVTFDPPREVYFEQEPANGRWVRNTLADGADGLTLTFTFAAPAEEGTAMAAEYRKAVAATLRAVRELVGRGELPAGG